MPEVKDGLVVFAKMYKKALEIARFQEQMNERFALKIAILFVVLIVSWVLGGLLFAHLFS